MGTHSRRNGSTEYVYWHVWPIEDEDVPLSLLKAQASRDLGPELGRCGVRPTARPRFTVADDRLVATVPVLRLDDDNPAYEVAEHAVAELIEAGRDAGHIAAELGVPRSAVEEIRARLESESGEPAEAGVAG